VKGERSDERNREDGTKCGKWGRRPQMKIGHLLTLFVETERKKIMKRKWRGFSDARSSTKVLQGARVTRGERNAHNWTLLKRLCMKTHRGQRVTEKGNA